jgi:Glutamine amidotransferase domain
MKMCKLLCIVDIENQDKALEFSEMAVKPMTLRDDDGLGVILMGDQGMGIERWLKPSNFPEALGIVDPHLAKYQALLPSGYNTEGETSQTGIYAIGVHSRMATGPKCLENVHPFVRDGIALTHNGVISNHTNFKKEVSSCDSEALLSLYLENNVKDKLVDVQHVCDGASGWYAFMVFDPVTQSVTIVKDDSTSLFFAHVAGIGTVFCTTEEIIKSCIGRMKLKQTTIYPVPPDIALRWTKGLPTVETYQLESGPVYTTKSLIDVSKEVKQDDNKWCEHGNTSGTWCGFCYSGKIKDEMNKDVPSWMRERV